MMPLLSTKVSILIVVLSIGIRWLSRTYFPNQPCNKQGDTAVIALVSLSLASDDDNEGDDVLMDPCQVFSETYDQARSRFRTLVEELQRIQSNIILDRLVVYVDPDTKKAYTTEIAVIPGTVPGLVVHTSGVHGVEGYAGSAIQLAFLQLLIQQQQPSSSSSKPPSQQQVQLPTLVLIHAVNPYGMAHYRRVNEHNVDLNRNGLTQEQFQTFADPTTHYNRAAYDKFDKTLFNPDQAPTWISANVEYWIKGVVALIQYGQPAVKAAMVGAQYHKPTGIFYGGSGQHNEGGGVEPSLQLLRDWWLRHEAMTNGLSLLLRNNSTTWIDVHTGLGPTGMDTLLSPTTTTDPQELIAQATKWFPGSLHPASSNSQQAKSVAQGYEQVKGTINDYFMTALFGNRHNNALIVTQEFGTLPTILVGRALIVENAAYHHLPPQEALKWAQSTTKAAFYPQSVRWRKQILQRGIRLLKQAMERSKTLSAEAALMSSSSQSQSTL